MITVRRKDDRGGEIWIHGRPRQGGNRKGGRDPNRDPGQLVGERQKNAPGDPLMDPRRTTEGSTVIPGAT